MKKTIQLLIAAALMIAAMLTGCGKTDKTIDIRFSEKTPEYAVIQEEVNMLKYLIAEPSVTYKMKATYTTKEGKTGEYMTYGDGGLCFKTKHLGKVKVEITASKEGKADIALAREIEITNGEPRVTSKDSKVFFIGDTVTTKELLEYITIVPKNAVETTFTKVTFNGKEVDLTGKSKYKFTESCAETTFYFHSENDGGTLDDTYTVKVTPYQNEAEKDDLVNYVDTSSQSGKMIVTYSEETSPNSKGSFSYKLQADPDGTWDSWAKAWRSYVFIQFPEKFDRTKQYITFDAKRSEDTYGAIVVHYIVGQLQQGAMPISIPANKWTECSTASYKPEAPLMENTEYTGICIVVLHKEAHKTGETYNPDNVWNLIDNMQIREFPKTNKYEEMDLTNNITKSLQDGKASFKYSTEVSELYDDPSKKGTYSFEIISDPTCVKGSKYYGTSYIFIDFPFDGSKVHPVFDIKRTADCDGNILVYYSINRQAQGSSTTYTEANKWNTVDTCNYQAYGGNTNTQYDGIAIIINHPKKPTSEYDVENVRVLIDNLRLEENWF